MVSQTLATQNLTPTLSPRFKTGNTPLSKQDNNVCGWLVDRTTLDTCLVVHLAESVTIGRSANCNLVLSDDVISNRHCRIYTSASGFVLCEDMSTNGTYWNGRLIGKGESVVLSHGDSIRIRRNHQFVFQDLLTTTLDHKDPEIETVEKSFQILPRTLGKGSFAKVNLAVHRKTKAQLAVKIMDRIRFGCPEKSGGTDINNEANILRAIDHANIVPVVDVIRTTRYMYIFMQMLPGGDLFDYIIKNGPLSEMEAKFAIYQILLALRHLHKQNISHRDLKPENILLTSATKYPRLLLTDFGMARDIGDTHVMKTMCGTFAYMAPEIFDVKHSHGAGYGTTADSWSLGITMYVVLSSTHPFTQNYANEEEVVMYRKVQSGALTFKSQIWTGLSSQVKDLIRGLLAKDPRTRWTVEKALDSDWIRNDLAWLRQKYRETTLSHWIKSTRHLRFVTLAGIDEGTTTPTTQQKSDRPEGIKRALSTYTEDLAKKQTRVSESISSAATSMARVPQVSSIRNVSSQATSEI